MRLKSFPTAEEAGIQAADEGAKLIQEALRQRNEANIIVSTVASHFNVFERLVTQDIDWSRVTAFHLDEYVGLPLEHPASFRLYLWKRFVSRLPIPIRMFHYLDGEGDCANTCCRMGEIIECHPIDVAFVGIGENSHLAFNDPPADFETLKQYLIVNLDDACRMQQVGEDWFNTINEVPRQALSMSVSQILKSAAIICTVTDLRKAEAIRQVVEGSVTPMVPASILQTHKNVSIYLDQLAGSLLSKSNT